MNDSMTMDDFDFSGSQGAEVAKQANKGGDFQREIEFLSLKADPASINQGKDQAIVRLVTEFERQPEHVGQPTTPYNQAWITVAQHYAPTKQRPVYVKDGGFWPDKWSAVCRKDKVFTKRFGGQCHICDVIGNKPGNRTWALGIERQQVLGDKGQVIGMKDKTREVFDRDEKGDLIVIGQEGDKKKYQMKTVPAWVVLNFGWKNFFAHLRGQGSYFESVMACDFLIRRSGTENNDTTYTFVALPQQTITGDWAQSLGVPEGTPYAMGHIIGNVDNGQGGQRPVNLAELLYPDMPDLRQIIMERVSDDYYGRYFIPGWLPEGFDPSAQQGQQQASGGVQQGYQPTGGYQPPQGQQQAPQAPDTAQPQAGPSTSALENLKARISGGAPAGTSGQ